MSDADVSLANIKACKSAADEFSRILSVNEAIAKANTNKTVEYRAAHKLWSDSKKIFDDKNVSNRAARKNQQSEWDNKKQSHKNDAMNERRRAQCGGCGTQQGCGSGWDWVQTHGCGWLNGQCENECKRNDTEGDAEASRRVGSVRPSEYIDEVFTEPEPKDKEGAYAYDPQITNAGNIQCCASILSIGVGDATNVSQSCSQQLTQLEQKITGSPPSAGSPPPPPTGSTPPPTLKKTTTPEKKLSNNTIIIIVILLFLLSCCSSMSGGLFMLNTGGGGGED